MDSSVLHTGSAGNGPLGEWERDPRPADMPLTTSLPTHREKRRLCSQIRSTHAHGWPVEPASHVAGLEEKVHLALSLITAGKWWLSTPSPCVDK